MDERDDVRRASLRAFVPLAVSNTASGLPQARHRIISLHPSTGVGLAFPRLSLIMIEADCRSVGAGEFFEEALQRSRLVRLLVHNHPRPASGIEINYVPAVIPSSAGLAVKHQ